VNRKKKSRDGLRSDRQQPIFFSFLELRNSCSVHAGFGSRREIWKALADRGYSATQISGIGFDQIPARTGAFGGSNGLWGVVLSQDKDLRIRQQLPQMIRSFQAVHSRHIHIH
jgi:hypothetical protein